ncbi:MAG: hypothetical protein M1834_001414 [Cirrosporium novae-zelandiae]|nr:MAG: hypothetical protein M1834_001414 [Cirrosporium novae-zelandiae]
MFKVPKTSLRCFKNVPIPIFSLSRASAACRISRFYSSSAPQPDNGSLSPILLDRARLMQKEHAQLSKTLAEAFDSKIAKQLGELTSVVKALKEWDKANDSLNELNAIIADPTTDSELRTLATDDLPSTTATLTRTSNLLKSSLIPPHPFDTLPCMLEIRPGAGGTEAALFAGDLLNMYTTFCARKGLRTSILKQDSQELDNASLLSEVIIEISTPGSYGILRTEAGVHRVQRVPATESKGRTHTSAASVLVLPSFPENQSKEMGAATFDDPESDYYIDPNDVRTDIMRARGAGGQHVNTTDSAVRLTHIPTNTVVAIQDSRSQPKNREKAWHILRSRIAQLRRETREEEMLTLRRSVIGVGRVGRGDKVRTYNWSQQRVTDHRSGYSVNQLADILEGGENLEAVMDSVRGWLEDQEIMGLLAEEEAKKKKEGKSGGKK